MIAKASSSKARKSKGWEACFQIGFLHQQAVDTTTPAGKAMFQMLGVFSEFERAMIQSRVKAGMARIKAGAPTKSGKPVGRPTISPAVERAIREHLKVGTGMLKTARLVGVGSGTVQRVARTTHVSPAHTDRGHD
jgi:DNA invertase Pin-like site-specific DNA recombinase